MANELISTTTIQLDRALYAFYSSFLQYLQENLSPIPVVWTTVEGYFPGFELASQFQDAPSDENVLVPTITFLLKPTSIEIESRVNYPWRSLTGPTDYLSMQFYTPIISLADASLRTKFQMYKGNFEIIASSFSPLYAQDLQMRFLGIFNNRYSYLPTSYSLVIPLQIVNTKNTEMFSELIQQPQIIQTYMPSTGVVQYYINVNIKPLFKLISTSYLVQNETMYQNTFAFEFLAQIPSAWLFYSAQQVNYINLTISTPQLTLYDYMAALVNSQTIGFQPRSYVTLQSLTSTLILPNFGNSMTENFIWTSLNIGVSGTQTISTVVTTHLDGNKFIVNINVTDSNYVNNPSLLQSQPITFYWGY